MPDKPRFYKQETDYSGAPACLRMVLEALGVSKTEGELRDLSDCTVLATYAFNLVEAARALGFTATRKFNLDFDELKEQLENGFYPIVYIRARLLPDKPLQEHAAIVVAIVSNAIELLDPWRGEV